MSGHQLAQGVASLGRNGESMLVHMQPREVAGLQALAMQGGGTLTINPETGLPEAGWFGDILGAVAPIAMGAFLGPAGLGMSALGAGMTTGALGFLATGDLMSGIGAGLGGYGGSNLAGNLSAFGSAPAVETTKLLPNIAESATTAAPDYLAAQASSGLGGMQAIPQNLVGTVGGNTLGAMQAIPDNLVGSIGNVGESTLGGLKSIPQNLVGTVGQSVGEAAGTGLMSTTPVGMGGLTQGVADTTINSIGNVAQTGAMDNIGSGVSKLMQPGGMGNYSDFLKAGYTDAAGNVVKNSALMDAFTVASPLLAIQPDVPGVPEDTSYQMKYEGPYTAQDRGPRTFTEQELLANQAAGSPELSYFNDANPYPGFNKAPGYAQGGMTTGGVANLYSSPDGTAAQNTLNEGYGLGRLNNLASANAMEQAKMGFAGGGAIAFDVGGYVPTMGGVASYGIAPTDLSQVAAIPNAGGTEASTPSGLSSLLGNAITDPMGRTTNDTRGGMGGKGGMMGMMGKLAGQATTPGLTMQDYINAAQRTYNPAASVITGTMPGAVEQAQFTNINPAQPTMKAAGGGLKDGGFVVPADVVSHLGNGSTDAGLAALQKRHNARPIRGAGDGMSDSIKTTIDGRHPARVADGEAYIPPEQVKRSGGAKKFYAMMDKVRKERTGSKKQGKKINPNKYMTT